MSTLECYSKADVVTDEFGTLNRIWSGALLNPFDQGGQHVIRAPEWYSYGCTTTALAPSPKLPGLKCSGTCPRCGKGERIRRARGEMLAFPWRGDCRIEPC